MKTLPRGWTETIIGDVCAVVSGSTPKTSEPSYWGGDVSWVTPDDLARHTNKFISRGRRSISRLGLASCSARIVPPGTVLFTSRAPIGYTAIAAAALCTNQGFKSLVPPPGISSDFIYWYLKYATPMIQSRASGTTFAEISARGMSSIPLPLPPTREQKRIVAAIEEQFSRIDAGIAGLERARANLRRFRVSALESLLSALGPSAKPRRLAELLVVPLANGRSVPDGPNGGFPVLRLTSIRNGLVDRRESKSGAWTAREASPYVAHDGDFLVIRGNGSLRLVGRGGLVHGEPGVAFPDTLIRVRLNLSAVDPEYLRLVWDSRAVRRQIESAARTTAGIHKINQRSLEQVVLALPSLNSQRELSSVIARIDAYGADTARVIESAWTRARRLRAAILSSAFAGELVPQDPQDEPAVALVDRIALGRPPIKKRGIPTTSKHPTELSA